MRYHVYQFSDKTQLWLFGPKFAQKWILGSEFQKSRSGFGINTSNIPCVLIFSQNRQLLIFWRIFGEIAQLRVIFWFKYCWGCWRELGGGWNELGGGGWRWMELGGTGWWWVHGLVIPNKKCMLWEWGDFNRPISLLDITLQNGILRFRQANFTKLNLPS